jgi:hypothetical protein
MEFRQFKLSLNSYLLIISVILFLSLLYACGGSEELANESASDTGSISFGLAWKNPSDQGDIRRLQSPSGDICVDYEIDTVDVSLANSSNNIVASASWSCSAHQGTLSKIPVGSGMTLTITAIVSGNEDWRNQISAISVSKDKNTPLGVIEMLYIGNDTESPTVESHYPSAGASSVPLNAVIIAVFSENVVAASVNTSTCTVSETATTNPIDCAVSYDSTTRTATITPGNLLLPDTNYTVTISEAVEDLRKNTLAATNWNFTTVNGGSTAPVANAGIDQYVTEGDQVTLDGSGSSDVDGAITSYAWEQQPQGTQVTLSGGSTATATFTAPEVDTNGEVLTFQLTVTDDDGLTASDTVSVNVYDQNEPLVWDNGNWDEKFWN